MPSLLRCPACDADVRVSRRHGGRTVACPTCAGPLSVPKRLGFRDTAVQAAVDRRAGHWLLTFAWLSGMSCLPVAPAVIWFLCARRIQAARDEDREVVDPLLAARIVAATALGCHVVYVLAALLDAAFLPLRFFTLG